MPKSNLLLATLLATSALFATGCTKKIDKNELQTVITSAFTAKGMALKSVDCPADKPLKAGDTFECTGELAEGDKVTISVKQKDDKGNLDFDTKGVLVSQDSVGKTISGPEGAVTAKCPKKLTVLKKGDKVECDVTRGEEKGKATVTVADDEQSYKVSATFEGKPPQEKSAPDEDPDAPAAAAAAE